nr:nuclease-related domain-containing protein [Salsipaludibacter albus]
MSRPKGNPQIRRQLRGEIRALVRSNWMIVAGLVVLWLGSLAVVTAMFVVTGGWDFRAGLFIGVWIAVAVWWLHYFLAWTGFRHRQMGLSAEAETGRILGRLGNDWHVVANLLIDDRYDIDHVVIGSDRVYACETKWTSVEPDIDRWMSRVARGRADGLQRVLANQGVDVEVVPVLVLWGRETARLAPDVQIDGRRVRIVAGTEWRTWLPKLSASGGGHEPRQDVIDAIDKLRMASALPAD